MPHIRLRISYADPNAVSVVLGTSALLSQDHLLALFSVSPVIIRPPPNSRNWSAESHVSLDFQIEANCASTRNLHQIIDSGGDEANRA